MLLRRNLAFAAGRISSGLINFAALAVYTRILDPNEYGEYAVAIAAVLLLQAVLFQWLRLGIVRFSSIYSEQELQSTICFGFAVLCGVSVPALYLAGATGAISIRSDLLWLAHFLLVGQAWHELNLETARSRLTPFRYLQMSVARAAISLAIGWPLASSIGASGAIIGLASGSLLSTLFGPLSTRPFFSWSIGHRHRLLELMKYGIPLTATVSLSTAILTIDRFFLAAWAGPAAVGQYSVGYDLAQQSLGVLMLSVNLGALPQIMRSAIGERSGQSSAKIIERQGSLLLFVAVPTTVALSILAKDLTHLALGGRFSDEAATIFPWIAFGSLAAGIKAYYLDLPFQITGRSFAQLLITLLTAIANLTLVWVLVPAYGARGAAAAMAATFLLSAIATWMVGRHVHVLPFPSKDLLTFVLGSLPMAAVLILSESENASIPHLMARASAGALAFLFAVGLLDREKVGQVLRRLRISPIS